MALVWYETMNDLVFCGLCDNFVRLSMVNASSVDGGSGIWKESSHEKPASHSVFLFAWFSAVPDYFHTFYFGTHTPTEHETFLSYNMTLCFPLISANSAASPRCLPACLYTFKLQLYVQSPSCHPACISSQFNSKFHLITLKLNMW